MWRLNWNAGQSEGWVSGKVGKVGEVEDGMESLTGRRGVGGRLVGDGKLHWQKLHSGSISGMTHLWSPVSTFCPAYPPCLLCCFCDLPSGPAGNNGVGWTSESGPHFLDSLCSGCLGALLKWSGLLGYYKGDFSETGHALKSLTWIIVAPLPSPHTHTLCAE